MKPERKNYNTTIRIDLIRSIKILAAEKDFRVNDLLEEAIQDLLRKYKKTVYNYNLNPYGIDTEKLSADGTVKRIVKKGPKKKE